MFDSERTKEPRCVFVYTELSVDGTSDIWFINFYSPRCSHCHELAPVVSFSHLCAGFLNVCQ